VKSGRSGKNLAKMGRQGGEFLPFLSAAGGILPPKHLIPGGRQYCRLRSAAPRTHRKTRQWLGGKISRRDGLLTRGRFLQIGRRAGTFVVRRETHLTY